MKDTLKRVQMLLEPEQHRLLQNMANKRGKSVAEIARRAIDLGVQLMEAEEEFSRREKALEKAEAFRQAMRHRRGRPLNFDVVADLHQIREERDENLGPGCD